MGITKEIQEEVDKRIKNFGHNGSLNFDLDLSNLNLTEVPIEILNIKNLFTLNLSNNNITKLLSNFKELKSLYILSLSNNQLEEFPLELTQLPDLETLYLDNNKISVIPKFVLQSKTLTFLTLNGNPIEIPTNSFNFENNNFTNISHWLREYYQKETPKSNTLKIPDQLKTSIKQYLNFFPDFVLQSKGIKINFEVTTVEEGLSLQIDEKDEDTINEINTYLQEYMGLLQHTNEELSIVFTKPATDFEKELLLTQQRQQIRNLENALDIKKLENSYLKEVLKQPILLSHSLIQTLHNATQDAQENLRANNIPVPFIQDGYLWQKMPDGKNIKLEKIEPLKSA